MYLRLRLLGRKRSKAEAMLFRTRLPQHLKRGRSEVLPGWRDEYQWDTVLRIAIGIAPCFVGLWMTTHPID